MPKPTAAATEQTVNTEAPAHDGAAVLAADKANADQELTLDEFCIRLSGTDRRVELIGGFHHSQTAAGVIKASQTDFAASYEEFINKPV